MEKRLDGNYTRILRAILNKSWKQHPTKQPLSGHLPPTKKTIQIRRTRHSGYCRRSKDELISDVIMWTPSHGHAKAGRLVRTNVQQLCANTKYRLEDLPEAKDDREGWDMMMMIYAVREWQCIDTHTHVGWLVVFYDISTLVSYLIPKYSLSLSLSIYIYIYIYILCKRIVWGLHYF